LLFREEKALTVLELLAVLVIISVVLGLAVKMSGFTEYFHLRKAKDELLSLVRYTRHLAISSGQNYEVVLIDNKCIAVIKEGESDYVRVLEVKDNISADYSRADKRLPFSPIGATNGAGSFILTDRNGREWRIIISPTGRIRTEG